MGEPGASFGQSAAPPGAKYLAHRTVAGVSRGSAGGQQGASRCFSKQVPPAVQIMMASKTKGTHFAYDAREVLAGWRLVGTVPAWSNTKSTIGHLLFSTKSLASADSEPMRHPSATRC